MANKVIEIKVKLNTDEAKANLNKLVTDLQNNPVNIPVNIDTTKAQQGANALNDKLKSMPKGDFLVGIKNGLTSLVPALKGAESGVNSLSKQMYALLANPLGIALTVIVVALKFLYEAFQSSVAGGKEIKAVFAGLSLVFDTVKDAIFGMGRAIIDVGIAAKKYLSGDFKGAAESMKAATGEMTLATNQFTNAINGNTLAIGYNLEKRQQANDKASKIFAVTQAKTNLLLVESRETLTDETASINAKTAALAKVTAAETKSAKENERIAQENLDILKARQAAFGANSEAGKKMAGDIRDAEVALLVVQKENAQNGIKLNKQKKLLNAQELADAKALAAAKKVIDDAEAARLKELLKIQQAINKERLDLEKQLLNDVRTINAVSEQEQLDKQAEDELLTILALQKKGQNIANLMALYNEKYITLQDNLDKKLAENADAKTKKDAENAEKSRKNQDDLLAGLEKDADVQIAADKKLAAAKLAIRNAEIDAVIAGFNILAGLAGKNKTLQRAALIATNALGIAKTIINTQSANAIAVAEGAAMAIPTFGASVAAAAALVTANNINAGISIASSIAATAQGLSAIGGSGGGSATGAGSGGIGASTLSPTVQLVGQGGGNNNSNISANATQNPNFTVKAVVSETEITNKQAFISKIKSSAEI
jgi:hypothetical protein